MLGHINRDIHSLKAHAMTHVKSPSELEQLTMNHSLPARMLRFITLADDYMKRML